MFEVTRMGEAGSSTARARAYATPLLVTGMGLADQSCRALEALPMRVAADGVLYDERWVQMLIQSHPTLLPVGLIEPALVPLEAVCVELPTPSGYVDNLLMTRDGGIVLVEAKLWRNPEARRTVIGQVLDYAKDLSRWTYEDLQRAVGAALKAPNVRLYDHVCGPDASSDGEVAFIDSVSRNLRLGRFLLLIAGDGIQEGAEQLTEFLQRHVGLHFTLALVELSLWRVPQPARSWSSPESWRAPCRSNGRLSASKRRQLLQAESRSSRPRRARPSAPR